MTPAPAIEVRGLIKRFHAEGPAALDQITTDVMHGSITGLVGPDGAGKTTLLRTLAGLLRPTSGTVRILGLDPLTQGNVLRDRIGYMPQKFGLYEDLTVLENLTLYADLRNVTGMERQRSFEKMLAFTDLARFTERFAGKLSGGMKQKLGLACSLLGTPDPPPGRARCRRGSHLPAGAVADGTGTGSGRHDRGVEHGLSGRGRAVR